MSGSGGLGPLPTSRYTKVLQEKAEALKKRRQTAEQVLKEAEERYRALESLGIQVPEAAEKLAQLRELAKKPDWEAVESQGKVFLEQLDAGAHAEFDVRREKVAVRANALLSAGAPVPDTFRSQVQSLSEPPSDVSWATQVQTLASVDGDLRRIETEYQSQLRSQALAFGEWGGLAKESRRGFEGKVDELLKPVTDGGAPDAVRTLNAELPLSVPGAGARRASAQETVKALVGAARELGAPVSALEAALRSDSDAPPVLWPASVSALESAATEATAALRDRVVTALQGMRGTLTSLKELGVDPTEAVVRLEEFQGRVRLAGPNELPKIYAEARGVTEEPVVGIVASLLDEVRPRLVEARRLGRDPSEVFAAMNRAREALRLKIYSEALAAAQEAVDKVGELTQDLDAARAEMVSLGELLDRLARAKVPVAPFRKQLETAQRHLDQMEVDAARHLLQQTIRDVGLQAYDYFRAALEQLETLAKTAREAGFLPPELDREIAQARKLLEAGELTRVGEQLAALDVQLRTAAGPHVSRRVEELEKGLEEVGDEALVAPVRRALADADVSLRVKEDLAGSLESLRRAEREFSTVFAAHASNLVETLENERRALEAMGGAGDEIQRQIDEVQQIFNMGDFVKASRASQEIRQRAHQQQLVRSEEAISHAKLALVELSKMGLDSSGMRATLDSAVEAAQDRRFADAYRIAAETERSASEVETQARAVSQGLNEATERLQSLKRDGGEAGDYADRITQARAAYQALQLAQARTILNDVNGRLRKDEAFRETTRLTREVSELLEDAKRLSVPVDSAELALADIRQKLSPSDPEPMLERVKAVHADLMTRLRPILDENLKSLEDDLDVARTTATEIGPVLELVAEARRKAGRPVPVGAAQAIETARTRLVESRGFKEQAERAMRRAQEAMSQSELVHLPVDSHRVEMQRIEERFADREYARVIERSATLEREVNQLTYQHLSKTLNAFQGLLVKAREDGSDTALAENLLQQARVALQEGRPLEALQLATRSEIEVERVELQVRLAQGALETIDKKYSATTAEGIRAGVAGEELTKAHTALDKRDYVTVLEHVFSAADTLQFSRDNYRKARDQLDGAEGQLGEAMRHGADLDEVAPILEAARQLLAQGEYPEAARKAREASERGRWAIEKQSAGSVETVRNLVEVARQAGLPDSVTALTEALQTAEIALKSREWSRSSQVLEQARVATLHALDAKLKERQAALETLYRQNAPATPAEAELRAEVLKRLEAEVGRQEHLKALKLIDEESRRATEAKRQGLSRLVADFKDRLWVGERLGLDTTPVMELFTEAKLALDAGTLDTVPALLARAESTLTQLVRTRYADKMRDVRTEMGFAENGLHVILGKVPERLAKAGELEAAGELVEAARALLQAEEELNSRKAMHRELLNIHYLVDAALVRASDRHLPTDQARSLLAESIELRNTDYAAALERARQALTILQGLLKGPEATAAGFWPFKRPPTPGGKAPE